MSGRRRVDFSPASPVAPENPLARRQCRPVLVHSASRDSVDALSHLLRNNGLSAYCTWIPSAEDIGDALEQINPELLVSFDTPLEELAEIASVRDQMAQSVPLLVLREHSDDALMSADMLRGARDSATLTQPDRVAAIIRRELRAFRLERTLSSTLSVAQDYRQQLQTVLSRSRDAIAQVQEGIIVDANASWLELLGYKDGGAVIGQPVMDLFDPDTHTPLRGALAACARGRWSDLPLKTGARNADGETIELHLHLTQGEFDGEPCVHWSCLPTGATTARLPGTWRRRSSRTHRPAGGRGDDCSR